MRIVLLLLAALIVWGNGSADQSDFPGDAYLHYRSLYGRPDSLMVEEPVVLIYLSEPSCTACKESLSWYFSEEGMPPYYLVVPDYGSTMNRKVRFNYLKQTFPQMKGVLFSLSGMEQVRVQYRDSLFGPEGRYSPSLAVLVPHKSPAVYALSYESLFEETVMNQERLDSFLTRTIE